MSDDNNTIRLGEDGGSLSGDALLHAMRLDIQGLFGLVKALNDKVERVDQKVEARLRDTTPMWEVVVSRLDTMVAEQVGLRTRLDAIEGRFETMEGRLEAMEGRLETMEGRLGSIEARLERLDSIESDLRQLRRRIERMIGELSHDVVEVRAAQHDLEDRLEKLEKTPG